MKNFKLYLSIPFLALLLSGCNYTNTFGDVSSSESNSSVDNSDGSSTSSSETSSSSSSDSSSSSSQGSSSSSSSSSGGTINVLPDTIQEIVDNTIDPSSYYSSITNTMSGTTLKSNLTNLIDGHIRQNYDNLEDNMRITDRNWSISPNVDDANPKMNLLYFTGNDDTNKQQVWNHYHTKESKFNVPLAEQSWDKEHIWAKSNGLGSEGSPEYSDLHHLRASDMKNNNSRSSLPFGEASSSSSITYVKDFIGNNSGKKGKSNGASVYEPLDMYKGDVARALLYMATRYATKISLTNGTDSSGGKWGFLSTLLKWNLQDAPDSFEIKRNSLVQYYQHNRNPFIDHPEYACRIYSSSSADASIRAVCE